MTSPRNSSKLVRVAAGLGTTPRKVQLALVGTIFLSIADYFFYIHDARSITALYAALPGVLLVTPMLYDCLCAEFGLTP